MIQIYNHHLNNVTQFMESDHSLSSDASQSDPSSSSTTALSDGQVEGSCHFPNVADVIRRIQVENETLLPGK